jgi:hypothetical protein
MKLLELIIKFIFSWIMLVTVAGIAFIVWLIS